MADNLKEMSTKKKSVWREYAEAFAIAIILALVIRAFVVQAFKIPSGSMLPTLQVGDHILVNKFIYWFTEPKRGDIIVFRFPKDEGRDFIKRIIGLPGETVEIKNKQVYINGQPFEEPYIIHEDSLVYENPHSPRDNFGPVVVPEGTFFMMGDNRDHSMDSRFWGFLEHSKIKGKAFIIYFSLKPDPNAPDFLPVRLFYIIIHAPELVRWERIGRLVH